MEIKHPAKYTDAFIPVFAEMLEGTKNVIDIFSGTCKITNIKNYGYKGDIFCNEIEPEWAQMGLVENLSGLTILDAEHLPYKDRYFDAICTSPTYGNRMADSHNAKDKSKRNTYTHTLGRKLHEENTGHMQWGPKYREKHINIWKEAHRILKDGGILILNVSDHIRKGEVARVSKWHRETLESLGFELIEKKQIETPRMRFGANSNLRVGYEFIILFKKS